MFERISTAAALQKRRAMKLWFSPILVMVILLTAFAGTAASLAADTVSLDAFLSGAKGSKGSARADGKSAPGAIVVDESDPGCELVGNWADNVGNNPEGKNFSGGDCVGGKYHYTSSHGQYRRTGKERAIYTPKIPRAGRYKVEVSWRGTSNRSSKVTYEVKHKNGKDKQTFSQRTEGATWKTLGTYPFDEGREGWAAMVSDGGSSASIDAAKFTWVGPLGGDDGQSGGDSGPGGSDGGTGDPGSGNPGGSDPGSGKPAKGNKITLDSSETGTREYTFENPGTAKVTAFLTTYGKASLKVTVVGADGKSREWMSWQRSNDTDPSTLRVNGKNVQESMSEVSPGDFSPNPVTFDTRCEKGDKIRLTLEGSFGAADPKLELVVTEN